MKPLTNPDGEVRELTEEDFARFAAAEKVLPADLLAVLPESKRRGERRLPLTSPDRAA